MQEARGGNIWRRRYAEDGSREGGGGGGDERDEKGK